MVYDVSSSIVGIEVVDGTSIRVLRSDGSASYDSRWNSRGKECEKNIHRYPTSLWQLYDQSAGEELAMWFFSRKNEFGRQTSFSRTVQKTFSLVGLEVYRYSKYLDSQGNYVEK